jgi:hypothetical protein
MQIKFNNQDKLNLNKKWIRITLLTFSLVSLLISLTQIFCIVFKPKGYEDIEFALGDNFIKQLFFAALSFGCYFLIKKSKP